MIANELALVMGGRRSGACRGIRAVAIVAGLPTDDDSCCRPIFGGQLALGGTGEKS